MNMDWTLIVLYWVFAWFFCVGRTTVEGEPRWLQVVAWILIGLAYVVIAPFWCPYLVGKSRFSIINSPCARAYPD